LKTIETCDTSKLGSQSFGGNICYDVTLSSA